MAKFLKVVYTDIGYYEDGPKIEYHNVFKKTNDEVDGFISCISSDPDITIKGVWSTIFDDDFVNELEKYAFKIHTDPILTMEFAFSARKKFRKEAIETLVPIELKMANKQAYFDKLNFVKSKI